MATACACYQMRLNHRALKSNILKTQALGLHKMATSAILGTGEICLLSFAPSTQATVSFRNRALS